MSTRGAYGFIYNKKPKLMYYHSDAYSLPGMMKTVALEVSKEQLIEIYNNLEELEGKYVLHNNFDREIQINNEFIYKSLHCEFAAVIDLDRDKLMLFEGFNEDKDKQHKYFYLTESIREYYACKFLKEFDLCDIPTNFDCVYDKNSVIDDFKSTYSINDVFKFKYKYDISSKLYDIKYSKKEAIRLCEKLHNIFNNNE